MSISVDDHGDRLLELQNDTDFALGSVRGRPITKAVQEDVNAREDHPEAPNDLGFVGFKAFQLFFTSFMTAF
jgi:hypothetical protein